MANKIRLKIGGIEYSVTSDEDQAYILSLGAELEAKMKKIMDKSPFLSTTMAAVMASLESLDESKKMQEENERLRLEIKRMLEETACAKLDADIAKRMLRKLSQTDISDVFGEEDE